MRDKFNRFMQGRYGTDAFARLTTITSLVCIIAAVFFRGTVVGDILDLIGFAFIIYTYYRMFSKNIAGRSAENAKYLELTQNIRRRFRKEKNLMNQRKTHHIYTCPGCGQKIRIPRGKGKIEIDCPRCHEKFVKRS